MPIVGPEGGWQAGEIKQAIQEADQADCLVTRNPRDFKQSLVPVMTPEAFLAVLT